jgi:MFS family permease
VYLSRQDQVSDAPARRLRLARVGRNVIYLGLTSLLTDISSEMVTAVMPIYLTVTLGFSGFQFGLFDGIHQGVTAFLRVAAGRVADQRRRHKEVAGAGYAVSAACKAGLLVCGTAWTGVVGFLLLDRVGKGIRTAPRDALIALSSPPARLAEAFGIHRTLDTVGALLGPTLAFFLLGVTPDRFDVLFLTSLSAAVLGLGVLGFFVENRQEETGASRRRAALSTRELARLLGQPGYARLLIAGLVFTLATATDAFVYLILQRRTALDPRFFPLFYVGTAVAYLGLAIPAGRLADRVGRRTVFLTGYALLLGAYGALGVSARGLPVLAVCLLLHGAYYACTDGVLMALTSSVLPADLLATGMACLTTVTTLARLLAAVCFGAVWSWRGPGAAVEIFGAALLAGLVMAPALLPRALPAEQP